MGAALHAQQKFQFLGLLELLLFREDLDFRAFHIGRILAALQIPASKLYHYRHGVFPGRGMAAVARVFYLCAFRETKPEINVRSNRSLVHV